MIKFEKPEYKVTEYEETSNYGKFELEPLEKGFGLTLGNALRRVMLSSLPGSAITSINIDGVDHEFQTLTGIYEDVTQIVLNLKSIVIKNHSEEEQTLTLNVDKEGVVTAGDIDCPADVEIINKDQFICTVVKGGKLNMELSENANIKSGKIFIAFNINVWCTKEIMKIWNEKKLRKYMDSLGDMVPNLLIMDQASMHITEDIIKEIEKYDTEIIFIPKDMTRVLQPLDVTINKPFKTLIRKKYAEYCCNKNLSLAKTNNNLIINWVSDIWWDEFAINQIMVKNSFGTTGISNNLDGSENLLFKAYHK